MSSDSRNTPAPTPAPDEADPLREAEAAYEKQVWRDLPRNYAAHLVHGLLGQTGFRLVHAPTFVPAYIFLLSGSEIAVGLALAAQYLGAGLSSIFGATLIETRKRVLPVGFVTGALMRLQVLGLALSGLFLPDDWALIAVVLFLGLFGFFNGMQAVMFNYLLSKVIPVSRRGRLTGLRNFLAGITASAVAYFGGSYFIESNALGNGYSATFLTAFIMTSIGLLMLLFVREPEPPVVRQPSRFRSRLKELPALLRSDPAYTKFFIARALSSFGAIAVPFYILYAGKSIGLSGQIIGILSIAFLLTQTATNLLWGAIADRTGNRFVFQASLALWAGSTILLMLGDGVIAVSIAFAGLGAGFGGWQIASQNFVLEFGNREDLPMRIAVSNTAAWLMMAAGPATGGLLASLGTFEWVFAVAIACKSAAFALVLFFVDEPRRRRA